MDKIEEKSKPPPAPEDTTISTLFLGNISTEEITEELVREQMEKFGKVERMRLLHRQNCGFVCFFSREAAEKAITTLHEKFFLCEKKIKLDWAKAQLQEQKAYRKKPPQGGKNNKQQPGGAADGDNPAEETKQPRSASGANKS